MCSCITWTPGGRRAAGTEGRKAPFPPKSFTCKFRRVAVASADAFGCAQLITRRKLKMLLQSRWLKWIGVLQCAHVNFSFFFFKWWKGPGTALHVDLFTYLRSLRLEKYWQLLKYNKSNNVIFTITSVNSLRCAYQSTDNNNSNALWSLMLLKVPLCCWSAGKAMCLKTFKMKRLFCCLFSVKPEPAYIQYRLP